MKKFTNNNNISLPLALWLADDDYDHSNDPNTISVTSLLKPIKQIVLARQNIDLDKVVDIFQLVPSRIGTALHTAIESSWNKKDKFKELLLSMGYSEKIVNRIKINPTKEELTEDTLAIYMEKRSSRKFGKYTVSGKFDFVLEGRLKDFKSTKVYGYLKGSNTNNYILQGSIYRLLNQDIILDDFIDIEYIFTDWNKLDQIKNPSKYPPLNLIKKEYSLLSVVDTEKFITNKLTQIESLETVVQSEIPACTQEELWQDDTKYKYYKDPNKRTRSTKNFDNAQEAHERCSKEGVGIVIEVMGQVRRCKYCDVALICEQAEALVSKGVLSF